MFPFEGVAGLVMVECFLSGWPAHDIEIPSIVLRMTAGAIHFAFGSVHCPCVITELGGDTMTNFSVTTKTLELRTAGTE